MQVFFEFDCPERGFDCCLQIEDSLGTREFILPAMETEQLFLSADRLAVEIHGDSFACTLLPPSF